MTSRWTAWGPAVLWAGALFVSSALPGTDRPPLLFAGEDKLAHGVLYAVLGVALARGWLRSGRTWPVWLPPLLGILYGVTDEWHQSWVPGRDPDPLDLAADTLGVLLGYGLLLLHSGRTGPRAGDVPEP